MRLDPNPLFRRIIIPWYDSPLMCWLILSLMVILLIFSITGITVAEGNPEYKRYVWIPVVMLVSCLFLLVSVSVRLIRGSQPPDEE